MKSTLLQGPVDKPWLQNKDWKVRASWWITFGVMMLGVAASAVSCFIGYRQTPMITQPLCLVMEDTEGATWRREVDMSGFGNHQFEMTTSSENNSFIQDGMLYIMPTLTSLSIPGGNASVFDGFTYNITGCTNTQNSDGSGCGAVSNETAGTIINPVMSARITTQKSHSIRYGKVEIRAKIPTGDWLWPALWMLPVDNAYGPWPLSASLLLLSGLTYLRRGSNVVRGSLNWGPTAIFNGVFKTYGLWDDRRRSFASSFHTYTLEWTPDFIRTYVDSRLHHMLDVRFNVPMFARGNFPATYQNGSQTVALQNPWIGRGNSAPFDQPFFLIMNVAVGGTNGWFSDDAGGKPWLDKSGTAMRDFALNQDKWYPTWPESPQDRAMVIDYVRMWKLC
ncbi:glycoside hydrolase family 16 protein [Hysterangium stoloniferum]|nr:glycoside hydrolase family 16 protein [Hysterangium stoloniferum]